MVSFRRILRWFVLLCLVAGVVAAIALAALYTKVSAELPEVQSLREIQLQEPMYVYDRQGQLMAVFGESRRNPVRIEEVPERLKQAFLATEDARFYEHGGVDYKGIGRAVWLLATTDNKRVPGGSTITQQVARQFYLSSEYSYTRKFAEILLARKIESELSKDEIFELYLNKSFFGNRAYGVAAAAHYYYGKQLAELDLDEMASLAAIPKFPSAANPISNPTRARERRDHYVLPRMAELGFVSQAEAKAAMSVPMHATPHEPQVQVEAPYVAEMVRQEMVTRYGDDVLNQGYKVYTTLDGTLQAAANKAVRDGLHLYDHRHGWHGVEKKVELATGADPATIARELAGISAQASLLPAVISTVHSDGRAEAVLADARVITLDAASSRWTNRTPARLVARGDIVRVRAGDKEGSWLLDQVPRGQSALVSLEADTGALRALVGGYSFAGNKFNRATQARRQPGSSFKPFVYAAAFDKGFNPGSIVLDAPVVFRQRNGKTWQPQNDGGGFRGPMRLREALVQSRNLVSVRMLDTIGVDFARRYISEFGFGLDELPPNLSMSLGTASLTPLSVTRGYAAFANGGSRIEPWFIDRIVDRNEQQIFQHTPLVACRGCGGASGTTSAPVSQVVDGFNFGAEPAPAPATSNTSTPATPAPVANAQTAPRAIDERTAWQLQSMMRDVVSRGTATAAKVLNRADVGGKTGSTNDHRDAWFAGFGGPLATVVWVGRDDFSSLGYREYGGRASLPIWIDYMRVALKDTPLNMPDPPSGMVQTVVNGATEWVKVEDMDRLQEQDFFSDTAAPDDSAFDIF
ncbi:peptidase [Stenotrophomonas ginsengisoli]|uniref:Penicillin-binding protein 1A n=1 Tax=Stenotrophomonas ginsengisoli TaxID=336566 RepID=A0A0R0D8C1_9GAMM|nr:penicillin-binding protein 1A [Stenotrophomonas ginsengisoli]KRG74033.1 peptidase [Stenotrophomonas ginsengisoli]